MIIEAIKIKKYYESNQSTIKVLKEVNLRVEEGELVAIVGPSGSGKTTLLNILGLLDNPTSGELYLNGKNAASLSDKEKRKIRLHKIGFIFQNFNLISSLTALENVELPMALAGVSSKEQRKRAIELLKAVKLDDKINSKIHELSMGEAQRVAIARAFANNPSIILADEPTAQLDYENKMNIIELLQKLRKERNTTIIVATHDLSITRNFDKIYELRNGKLLIQT
ncbi:MAG: ABC transporter ATP-binding protein [Candidatus Baldrarchaeota archaeon]